LLRRWSGGGGRRRIGCRRTFASGGGRRGCGSCLRRSRHRRRRRGLLLGCSRVRLACRGRCDGGVFGPARREHKPAAAGDRCDRDQRDCNTENRDLPRRGLGLDRRWRRIERQPERCGSARHRPFEGCVIGFGPGIRRCSLIARSADRLGFDGYAWSNAGSRTDYLPEIDPAWLGCRRRHRRRGAWNRRYLHERHARGRRRRDRYGRRLRQSGHRWRGCNARSGCRYRALGCGIGSALLRGTAADFQPARRGVRRPFLRT